MGDETNHQGSSRRWIMTEVEDSLRRLGTDYIDLYQVHRPREDTDVEETLSALTDLVRAGKIRYFGSSTFPASQIVEAQWVARDRGLERFKTEQPPYSMLVRGIEADVLPTAQRHGMGVIPWSPLAGGWLSRQVPQGRRHADVHARATACRSRYDLSLPGNQRKFEAADALGALADEVGIPLIEIAIAWVINHPAVTSAIIGPRTMEHLESQLPAATRTLDAELLDRIDEIVPPATSFNYADTGYAEPGAGAGGAEKVDCWRRAAIQAARRRALACGVHRAAAVRAACPLRVALAPQAKAAKASDHGDPPFRSREPQR